MRAKPNCSALSVYFLVHCTMQNKWETLEWIFGIIVSCLAGVPVGLADCLLVKLKENTVPLPSLVYIVKLLYGKWWFVALRSFT